ncbi:hypothetical protein [Caulobacter phage KcrB]|nr:hypothetical protein RW_GP048 [Caulobacter phage RW]WCA46352.1 hypothetical protein [Caulobacter phage KcrB]WCD56287.1 hypothetical protein [Caulobacter phage RLK]WNV48079.1 hypothetical protein GB2A_gp047 [Caulobacter phage GB2A]
MTYRIFYRAPSGRIETDDRPSMASVLGVLQHLIYDYEEVWVRETPSGAIILVYDGTGALNRP